MNTLHTRLAASYLTLLFATSPANAVILFGAENSANQTAPGNGLPFDSVGQLPGGTGVYLGNGYVLTADHVNPISTITFDGGATTFSHDGAMPVQIGNTDMKVFRLTSTPTVAAANIYTGTEELLQNATLVGTGLGRGDGTTVGTTVTIPWGSDTRAKRWGLNAPKGLVPAFSYSTYTFDAIQTTLGATLEAGGTPPGEGASEAATTLFDSGAGLFQNIGGIWYLTGITSVVTQRNGNSTSTFGDDVPGVVTPGNPSGILTTLDSGDLNLFVRVSSYAPQIISAIPEPSALVMSLASLLFMARRRR